MSDELMRPIHFREVFKTKVWGGRRLESVLHKSLPPREPIGESWETSDHDHGMSVVDEGAFEGRTLRQLAESHGEALLGRPDALEAGGRFPLLFKFLDAANWLSVQVHPDDAYANEHERGEAGKTEAWYVLESRRNGRIIGGIKPGRAAGKLRELAESGEFDRHLKVIAPRAGEAWWPTGPKPLFPRCLHGRQPATLLRPIPVRALKTRWLKISAIGF